MKPGPPDELLTRVDLALSQAKRVEREVRLLKQMLAGLRDDVQPEEGQNEHEPDARDGRLLEVG